MPEIHPDIPRFKSRQAADYNADFYSDMAGVECHKCVTLVSYNGGQLIDTIPMLRRTY